MSCNVITAGHCRGPVWVNTVRPCVGTSSATAEMSFLWTEKPAEMSLPRLQSLSALITNTMNSGQTAHQSWKDYQLATPPALRCVHRRQSGSTTLLSECRKGGCKERGKKTKKQNKIIYINVGFRGSGDQSQLLRLSRGRDFQSESQVLNFRGVGFVRRMSGDWKRNVM